MKISEILEQLIEKHTKALTSYTDNGQEITDHDTRLINTHELKQDLLKQIEQTLLEAMPEEKDKAIHPERGFYESGYNQGIRDCIQAIKESMK